MGYPVHELTTKTLRGYKLMLWLAPDRSYAIFLDPYRELTEVARAEIPLALRMQSDENAKERDLLYNRVHRLVLQRYVEQYRHRQYGIAILPGIQLTKEEMRDRVGAVGRAAGASTDAARPESRLEKRAPRRRARVSRLPERRR